MRDIAFAIVTVIRSKRSISWVSIDSGYLEESYVVPSYSAY